MPKVISDYTKQQIADTLKHKSITQTDIARAFGVSRATIRSVMDEVHKKRKTGNHRKPKDIWDSCPITGLNFNMH